MARRHVKWWAVLFLPILLRALVPVGFMPMIGPDFAVRLVLCESYAPVPRAAMPAGMSMDMSMDMGAASPEASGGHGAPAGHDEHGSCPYGSAPVLGALPSLASFPSLLLQRVLPNPLATAQVAYVGVALRAQSPRGPPA